MDLYLPIAEMSVNLFVLLGLGGAVGLLSGIFGVGGGFLMTPLLIFIGIPPPVAVGSEASQILASSVSGVQAHMRRGNVDVKMGLVLLTGGIVGSVAGVQIVKLLRIIGQVDLVISLCYVFFLGIVGSLMLIESIRAVLRKRQEHPTGTRRSGQRSWIQRLPFKYRFKRSKLYISIIPPLMLGLLIGLLSAVMGVGGGFIMMPAMIYLLRMPTAVAVGTSLFQIMFVTSLVAILHAVQNQSVDAVLALLLIVGSVFGVQVGVRFGQRLAAEQLRALLAVLVLAMAIKLLFDLAVRPDDLFVVQEALGGE
jgi:uncharacterized membrane protein YfcA